VDPAPHRATSGNLSHPRDRITQQPTPDTAGQAASADPRKIRASCNTVYLGPHGCYSGWVPRAGWVKPETDQRLSDHISVGVLTRVFPPELVDRAVAGAGRTEQRSRLLPARVVVYYVLGLALFAQSSYEEVMRLLVQGLSWGQGWTRTWTVPTKAALFKARARLGPQPLQALYEAVATPLATLATRGAFYREWRLMSIDGTCLDVADTAANAVAFGRPGSGRGEGVGAFPQLRVVGMAECGTHAIVGAVLGPYSTGEQTLADDLVSGLEPGMLVLADRGFYSFALWGQASGTGAELLWRVRSRQVLPVDTRLPDGSYLSTVHTIRGRRQRRDGVLVRVIEYTIDAGDPTQDAAAGNYRLLTTILDPDQAPARELAALYRERWEFETALDELKTHQRSPRLVLRSKMPAGVIQEAYAYLCVHYAIRWVMHAVASEADTDPDRLSFTRALRVARRTASHPGFPPDVLAAAPARAADELLFELLPRRRPRVNPRVVKRKMSNFAVKRAEHRTASNPPPPTRVLRILTSK
jgi:Insertion element 4 transposase N-terminal/Transposase DDE domain